MMAQIVAVSRSVMERPVSTAQAHIGSVRSRSMNPVATSLVSPTAVPMLDVVRFITSKPGITNWT